MQQLYAFTATESALWVMQYFASGPQNYIFSYGHNKTAKWSCLLFENFNLSKFSALFLTGGRDQSINIAVTTDDSEAVEAIKDGFLQVFEHVVIQPHSSVSGIAPLPVGFSAGVKGAQHRIANLVRGKKIVEGQVIIGFEEMVCELLPGK